VVFEGGDGKGGGPFASVCLSEDTPASDPSNRTENAAKAKILDIFQQWTILQ